MALAKGKFAPLLAPALNAMMHDLAAQGFSHMPLLVEWVHHLMSPYLTLNVPVLIEKYVNDLANTLTVRLVNALTSEVLETHTLTFNRFAAASCLADLLDDAGPEGDHVCSTWAGGVCVECGTHEDGSTYTYDPEGDCDVIVAKDGTTYVTGHQCVQFKTVDPPTCVHCGKLQFAPTFFDALTKAVHAQAHAKIANELGKFVVVGEIDLPPAKKKSPKKKGTSA